MQENNQTQENKKKTNNNWTLIYKLYEELNPKQKQNFLKRFGLFEANFLNLDLEAKIKNINKEIRYNINDSETKKILFSLEHFVNNSKKVVLLRGESLKDRIIGQCDGLYDIVDSIDDEHLLILVQSDTNPEKELEYLKERKEQGFCQADLITLDYHLVKQLIPKLLEIYRTVSKHIPNNMSFNEWDNILKQIAWFCNEYVTLFKNDDGSDEYKNKLKEARKHFIDHFMDLW